MKDRKFVALSSFFFLLFIAGIITVAIQQPTSQVLRAKTGNVSALKSFMIVFPQIAVAGDETAGKKPTSVKVSVFIRDENGTVMPGRTVRLVTEPAASVKPGDTISTDDLGMSQFFITSATPGTVKLTATDVASNTAISSAPTVEFTQ